MHTSTTNMAAAVLAAVLAACTPGTTTEPQTDPGTATSPAEDTTSSPSPSPAPPPAGTSAPSPADSTSPSPAADGNDTDTTASAGPRGDDAPVILQGRVIDVVDGDTIDIADERVRLAIANTPEVYGGLETCGREASAFTAEFLAGQTVAVYRPDGAPVRDGFDRLVGEVVRVTDGSSLNVALVAAGLAEVDDRFTDEDPDLARRLRAAADGAPADPGCERHDDDSDSSSSTGGDAAASGDVVFAAVVEDGPGNDVEVYNGSEHVVLRNDGSSDVALGGWTLVDEADNRIVVPDGFVVRAGAEFRIYSGDGDDVVDARYFADRSRAMLNNSGGDDLRLLDASGATVATYSY